MIESVFAALAARGIGRTPAIIAALALAVALVVGSYMIWLGRHDAAVVERHGDRANAALQEKARTADQHLDGSMRQNEAAIAARREEFNDATSGLPNEGLTVRQRIDLCLELRDAGANTRDIAECRDLPAGASAGPVDRHPARQ